jgi:hypothetical protein
MTRSLACFSVSFLLWVSMAVPAAGQAVVEAGLGAARAATSAGPAKGIGKSMSGLSVALDKALKQGKPVSDEQPAAVTMAKPTAKTPSTTASASPEPPPNWEDPSGVEPGLGYEELVRRFGPPTMGITNSAGRSLTYRGKEGVFQVEVRDGVVAAIDKPHR